MRWRLNSCNPMRGNKRKAAYRYGFAGEYLAMWSLKLKGYRILAMRYRNPLGEIDIVAWRRNTLVAVEVKARKTLAECAESIPPWKQEKIARAVQGLLASPGKIPGLAVGRDPDIRFDVVWVVPWRWPVHIKDAWRL